MSLPPGPIRRPGDRGGSGVCKKSAGNFVFNNEEDSKVEDENVLQNGKFENGFI